MLELIRNLCVVLVPVYLLGHVFPNRKKRGSMRKSQVVDSVLRGKNHIFFFKNSALFLKF